MFKLFNGKLLNFKKIETTIYACSKFGSVLSLAF